jgi:hypothetical protein
MLTFASRPLKMVRSITAFLAFTAVAGASQITQYEGHGCTGSIVNETSGPTPLGCNIQQGQAASIAYTLDAPCGIATYIDFGCINLFATAASMTTGCERFGSLEGGSWMFIC